MQTLGSKIFIDGGVPDETRHAHEVFQKHFGYPLDGQTTNPTLIAKNLQARIKNQESRITQEDALNEYKKIVQDNFVLRL